MKYFYEFYLQIQREAATTTNYSSSKEAQRQAPAVDDNKIKETARTINTLLTKNRFLADLTYGMMNSEMKKILLNDTNFQKIKNLFTRNNLPTIAIDKLFQIAKKDNTLTTTPTTPAAPAQTAQTA
jgi:hypothetical protein